jgi:hypothetical protein
MVAHTAALTGSFAISLDYPTSQAGGTHILSEIRHFSALLGEARPLSNPSPVRRNVYECGPKVREVAEACHTALGPARPLPKTEIGNGIRLLTPFFGRNADDAAEEDLGRHPGVSLRGLWP